MQVRTVEGGGGLRLHVRGWGNPRGPAIFLVHGWSQNHLSWRHQFESDRADEFRLVVLDNRGHGMSEKPLEEEHYTDERLWADDVAAVISAQPGARRLRPARGRVERSKKREGLLREERARVPRPRSLRPSFSPLTRKLLPSKAPLLQKDRVYTSGVVWVYPEHIRA